MSGTWFLAWSGLVAVQRAIDEAKRVEAKFWADYCHWHHRAEPLRKGDFRLCFECGHVWRTREEFEADVVRESLAAGVEPDLDQPFCPLCCHDF